MDDCVPSIWDDKTASFRTYRHKNNCVSGRRVVTPSRRPRARLARSMRSRSSDVSSSCDRGSGAGTNARTSSPTLDVRMYFPEGSPIQPTAFH